MATFTGFGELRTPRDLVQKLQYDLERIRKSPQDHYAAFDFFVTAEHIVDWIYPSDRIARENLRSSSPLLRITSHLANGGKHFEATARHHTSVVELEKSRYAEPGYFAEDYVEEPLVVFLTQGEEELMGHRTIEAVFLAQQVFDYWKVNAP